MDRIKLIIILLLANLVSAGYSQEESRELTLEQAINMARRQSPDALAARHSFQASYWQYRSFKANFLPNLSLSSDPYLKRKESPVTIGDGTTKFVTQDQMYTDVNLYLDQYIPFTGGYIYVNSKLQRIDEFRDNTHSYNTTPVLVGYKQNIFGYKSLYWEQKTQPLAFDIAKRKYVENMERVAYNTCLHFFNLAQCQSDLKIAQTNYANADTLYRFAEGRYNIGTITENELLQLEINKLQNEKDVIQAEANVNFYQQKLRSYLGVHDGIAIDVIIDEDVPELQIEADKVMVLTMQNNSDILNLKLKQINSESSVAYAKANRGLTTDFSAEYGITRTAEHLDAAYKDPIQQHQIKLSLSIPLLDWGKGKGSVKVAESKLELTRVEIEQERDNLEQDIIRTVWEFNLQSSVINIAKKTSETAQRHHDITQKLYLLGKSTILDLNASIESKDSKQKSYISTIANYWSLYYTLRRFTLHDFESDMALTDQWVLLLNK